MGGMGFGEVKRRLMRMRGKSKWPGVEFADDWEGLAGCVSVGFRDGDWRKYGVEADVFCRAAVLMGAMLDVHGRRNYRKAFKGNVGEAEKTKFWIGVEDRS